MAQNSIHKISVIVPDNPFLPTALQEKHHCLCAMDVDKLMLWWPGTPHSPHRNPDKVKAIQRSLDWKRVAQIAAYLLQSEIIDAPDKINKYFKDVYEPKKNEPGREWPPKLSKVIGYNRSEFPTFSNVLIHVNGAKIENVKIGQDKEAAAKLVFDANSKNLNFSVIDGQHRINGAYLALCIYRETKKGAKWEIPAEIFLDLDQANEPPRKQAQIFIDVNFYQKKVDKSLVSDLFPTARGREAIDQKERAQDIGRKLMLETGPLVGMIQIPGIKYGVKDVITLSTLNSAVEDVIDIMERQAIVSLEMQTEFIAQCLEAWLVASGRQEEENGELDPQNVVYQGRILVSILTLIPAIISKLKKGKIKLISDAAKEKTADYLKEIATKADLLEKGKFISKDKFKKFGYLGSGGIGRFRNVLWASTIGTYSGTVRKIEKIAEIATKNRNTILKELGLS
jgi:DGQHR domain-containing protein